MSLIEFKIILINFKKEKIFKWNQLFNNPWSWRWSQTRPVVINHHTTQTILNGRTYTRRQMNHNTYHTCIWQLLQTFPYFNPPLTYESGVYIIDGWKYLGIWWLITIATMLYFQPSRIKLVLVHCMSAIIYKKRICENETKLRM